MKDQMAIITVFWIGWIFLSAVIMSIILTSARFRKFSVKKIVGLGYGISTVIILIILASWYFINGINIIT